VDMRVFIWALTRSERRCQLSETSSRENSPHLRAAAADTPRNCRRVHTCGGKRAYLLVQFRGALRGGAFRSDTSPERIHFRL